MRESFRSVFRSILNLSGSGVMFGYFLSIHARFRGVICTSRACYQMFLFFTNKIYFFYKFRLLYRTLII